MMNSKKKTQKKIQKKIDNAEKFQKIAFLIPVFGVLSTIWSALILTCFPKIFIIDGKLPWYSVIITVIIIVPNAILSLIKTYYDRIQNNNSSIEVYKKSQALYSKLIEAFNNIVNLKHRRIIKSISENNPTVYVDPSEQISDIFKELKAALCFILSNKKRRVDESDIYINLLYRVNDSQKWIPVELSQEGLSYDDLMQEKSFFKYLYNSKSNFLFYNSKQELLDIDHYIQDERDIKENNELKGSILGFKFDAINVEGHKIKVLLFVSSFSTKFVEANHSNEDISARCSILKENISEAILPQFVSRIKLELCNNYVNKYACASKQATS